MSADLLSRSVILPFPSSPHWAPITMTLAKGLSKRYGFHKFLLSSYFVIYVKVTAQIRRLNYKLLILIKKGYCGFIR